MKYAFKLKINQVIELSLLDLLGLANVFPSGMAFTIQILTYLQHLTAFLQA